MEAEVTYARVSHLKDDVLSVLTGVSLANSIPHIVAPPRLHRAGP